MNLRIATFVTASAFAHGVIALWSTGLTPRPLALGGETRALNVTLLPAAQAADYSAVETRSVQTSSNQHVATQPAAHNAGELRRTDNTAPMQIAEITPQPAAVIDPPAPTPDAATPQRSSAKNISKRISAALKNRLAKYFEYPWLARQRGWQGRVLISLRVASNGDLSDWKVIGTSGYRTLDQSALNAARRIEHLPQAEHWLNNESLEVRLPVQYKLLDG